MTKPKFLADMGVSPSVTRYLRDLGFDAVHLTELLPADSADEVILELAAHENRVVLTMDHDFGTLLYRRATRYPSVVFFRTTDARAASIIENLRQVIDVALQNLLSGAIITVDDSRIRVRSLPIP